MEASNVVALEVLANHNLFTSIVQFSTGAAYFAHQVKEQLVCTSEAYGDGDFDSIPDVELWRSTVCAGDRRTLEAPQVLSVTDVLGKRLQQMLDRITEYAVTHTKYMALLQWLEDHFPEGEDYFSVDEGRALGEQGDVEIAKWVLRCEYELSESTAAATAASQGHVELVNFRYESPDVSVTCYEVMSAAASHGQLEVVQLIFEVPHGECWHGSGAGVDEAAANGHLDIVCFLHENGEGECTAKAMDNAATNGHLDVVKLLHENR